LALVGLEGLKGSVHQLPRLQRGPHLHYTVGEGAPHLTHLFTPHDSEALVAVSFVAQASC
jgi:hypothetical protein